ncbi:MAG: 3-dehydroquinate synthase [Clostridiales bacterium]|jgi:3-dehydroquinate synthase|nr:3-dehydroquinate synthase [Clostridiales bacterium]
MECLNYPIYFNESFGGLADAFAAAGLNDRRVCLITDRNVSELYLDEVRQKLSAVNAETFIFTPGEESKNLDLIRRIYEFFLSARVDRGWAAVALGGGVAGDIAGFAAATFMRGIKYVQIPTTLLAQVDSSVGGKTGVDFNGHKNLVGAFYQPAFVYINIGALDTLPPDQFSSGMAEAIKSALIADREFYDFFIRDKELIRNKDKAALLETVKRSCRVKAAVVTADERENGLREILNFGHTFGHAIESLSRFTLPHGHCVALGIAAAMRLSLELGRVTESNLNSVRELLRYFGLPVTIKGLEPEAVLNEMTFDKKNRGGGIRLVLLEAIGKAAAGQSAGDASILRSIRFITD